MAGVFQLAIWRLSVSAWSVFLVEICDNVKDQQSRIVTIQATSLKRHFGKLRLSLQRGDFTRFGGISHIRSI